MIISTLLATFLTGVIESIETLTVVLATALTSKWKAAFLGLFAGILTLTISILLVGRIMITAVPSDLLNGVIGLFLFLFGSRWLV